VTERLWCYWNLCINIQSVPRSKHWVCVMKSSQLMLYREIIAVCSQIHTKHINTLCGQNVELLNVKLAVHPSFHILQLVVCLILNDNEAIPAGRRKHYDLCNTFRRGNQKIMFPILLPPNNLTQ
jgi:hypothetical protein